MKTTLSEILKYNPSGIKKYSNTGWDLLTKTLKTKKLSTEVDFKTILETNGIEFAVWALRTQKIKDYKEFFMDISDLFLIHLKSKIKKTSYDKEDIKTIKDVKKGTVHFESLTEMFIIEGDISIETGYSHLWLFIESMVDNNKEKWNEVKDILQKYI